MLRVPNASGAFSGSSYFSSVTGLPDHLADDAVELVVERGAVDEVGFLGLFRDERPLERDLADARVGHVPAVGEVADEDGLHVAQVVLVVGRGDG